MPASGCRGWGARGMLTHAEGAAIRCVYGCIIMQVNCTAPQRRRLAKLLAPREQLVVNGLVALLIPPEGSAGPVDQAAGRFLGKQ
jgi:hypothetical protein